MFTLYRWDWNTTQVFNSGQDFGEMPQSRAEHMVFRLISALWVGMKTMMRCRPVGLAMVRWSPADIPPGVLSLADEVDERFASLCTSTT